MSDESKADVSVIANRVYVGDTGLELLELPLTMGSITISEELIERTARNFLLCSKT